MAKFYAKAPNGSDATLSITVSGFTQSLQQNGWCKMPNGLILQWAAGKYYVSNLGNYSFPISFPNIKPLIIYQETPGDDSGDYSPVVTRAYSQTKPTKDISNYFGVFSIGY